VAAIQSAYGPVLDAMEPAPRSAPSARVPEVPQPERSSASRRTKR